MESKRGFTTFMLIFFITFSFVAVIAIGVLFYGLSQFSSLLSQIPDFTLGNVSFNETYTETLGRAFSSTLASLSNMATSLVIGMVLVMLILGYSLREKQKLLIIVDIVIIIIAFIFAVYISSTFNTFINSDPIYLDVYSTEIQDASTYLLNLPIFISIIGVLIILVTYLPFKKKQEEPNVLQFAD